ncbi:hypothetical protein GF325_14775, partial [Candidatus Bathyarchaeota archaeon]|nr:hypothetical protein [Candidatus Bathyarchaeota archaeon]
MYNKNIGRKNLRILLVLAIVGGIAGVIFGWALPAWLAELNLDKQMYANKAGVDFIRVNLLNWAELWVPLIPATIATVVLLYPKKFLDAVPIRKSKYKKLLTYGFSGIIFGATYGISWLFNRLSY